MRLTLLKWGGGSEMPGLLISQLKKSIHCTGGLCGAIALKFWRSGQCCEIFPRCYAAYKVYVTRIKLICKSLIYSGGVLEFLAQSPNYAGVLDEIICFFPVGTHLMPIPTQKFTTPLVVDKP